MNDNTQGHNPPDISFLACSRDQLPVEWRSVFDDLVGKGFHTAANHLRQMATYMDAAEYWQNTNKRGR